MKNFVQAGDTIVVPAPAAVASGAGVLVGNIFGVALFAADNGADVPIKTRGVFELPKAGSQAWTVGARVYWDNGNNRCTNVATGNYPIGVATVAVGNGAGETTGTVRLDGIATEAAA